MLRLLTCLIVLFTSDVQAQVKSVQFEAIHALQQKEDRLVVIFIETDWCKYCKAMKHAMSKNKDLVRLLNEEFYTVFLNAESRNDISFAGKLFSYKPTGTNVGVHELAEHLGTVNGNLSFPSLCFLNEKNEIVFQYPGFLDMPSLLKLLTVLTVK